MQILTFICLSILLASCASSISQKELNPDQQVKLAHIHYQLGIDALGKEGMLPKAFDELMESNTIRPNQAHVMDALAYAWLLRGDLKKSESYYVKAIQYGASASIYNNYASLLNRLEHYPKAEKNARKALDDPRYPNQDLAFINLGNAMLGQHKYPQAIKAFQQAKLFNASNVLADYRIAYTYDKQDKLREARLLYEALIRKQQGDRNAVEGLISVLNKQHDSNRARTVLNEFSQQAASPLDKAWALNQLDRLDRP